MVSTKVVVNPDNSKTNFRPLGIFWKILCKLLIILESIIVSPLTVKNIPQFSQGPGCVFPCGMFLQIGTIQIQRLLLEPGLQSSFSLCKFIFFNGRWQDPFNRRLFCLFYGLHTYTALQKKGYPRHQRGGDSPVTCSTRHGYFFTSSKSASTTSSSAAAPPPPAESAEPPPCACCCWLAWAYMVSASL